MNFLPNNCIATYKLPETVERAHLVDYSSELDLFATAQRKGFTDSIISVWDPNTRRVVAEFKTGGWGDIYDLIFLPGGYLAVSNGYYGFSNDEPFYGGNTSIFSVNEAKMVLRLESDSKAYRPYYGRLALTPDNKLLVSDPHTYLISEIHLDLKIMKLLSFKVIWTFNGDNLGLHHICCSKHNYTIYSSPYFVASGKELSCADVKVFPDDSVELVNQETITHCFIDGKKEEFGNVLCLAHDGVNVIVANEQNIIALESATKGSRGHIIAPGIPLQGGQIRINHKGQLIVCNKENSIKVYDYKTNCLQGLCRNRINGLLKNKEENVNGLPLPCSMKDYLLYRR